MPVTTTLDDDFRKARDEFLDQLAEDDRKTFRNIDTPEDLTNRITQMMTTFRGKKKTTKMLQVVAGLTEGFTPYFDALGLIAQGVSGYAAVAWGSIWLILKMASRFPSFFEKLGDLLLQVSTHIPRYRKLLELVGSDAFLDELLLPADMLSSSLHALYIDLFDLFGNIGKVFTQKDGRLKKTPLVIAHLLWHPFESRFENFLKKLTFHTKIFDSEMLILSLKNIQALRVNREKDQSQDKPLSERRPEYNDILQEMKQEMGSVQTRELLDRIRKWLGAPSFADALERACSLRQEGTADWLFGLPKYKSWLTRPPEPDGLSGPHGRLLWVKGNPGTGKTIVAASTVAELRALHCQTNDNSKVLSYFFFDYSSPIHTSTRSAYASLLIQILHQCSRSSDIIDLFSYAMTQRTQGQDLATTGDMADILKLLKPLLKDWYIVIDAADECEGPELFLKSLTESESTHTPSVLIFSRPNVNFLRRNVSVVDTITVTPDHVNADLRCFFSDRLEHMQSLDLLADDTDLEDLIGCLLTGADGMFEWARLMISYLESDALTISSRVRAIRRLKTPERLEDMYMRILTMITQKLQVEQVFARRVFMWLVFGKDVGRLDQLQDLLQTLQEEIASDFTAEEQRHSPSNFADFEHSIVMICSSLVEVRWSRDLQSRICCFIHYSAFEFFRMKCSEASDYHNIRVGDTQYLHPPTFEAESELLLSCFQYRQIRKLDQPLSGNLFEAASCTVLDKTRPFLRYATLFWVSHLTQPPNTARKTLEDVLATLETFLANGLGIMAWIEALYTYRADCQKIFNDLRRWASKVLTSYSSSFPHKLNEIADLVHALVKDLHELDKMWKVTLLQNPNQIWNDITAFSKSPFFVQTSATIVKQLLSETKGPSGLSSVPLCQISREKAGEDLFAILNIWPSKLFENANDVHLSATDKSVGVYQGWIAQYQLWNIGPEDPVVKAQWDFPLDEQEISSHVARQTESDSYWRPVHDETDFRLYFPTSIGQNLDTFTVLHTVYVHNGEYPSSLGTCETEACDWLHAHLPIAYYARSLSFLQSFDRSTRTPSNGGIASNEYRTVFKTPSTKASRIFTHNDLIIYQGVGEGYSSPLDASGMSAFKCKYSPGCLLAIYKMKIDGKDVNFNLIAVLDGQRYLDHENMFDSCTFHPSLPLLALVWHTNTIRQCAALWSFSSKSSVRSFRTNIVSILDFYHDTTSTSKVLVDCGPVARVQFSGCGNRLLVEFRDQYYPTEFPLRDCAVYHAAVAEHEFSQGRKSTQLSHISHGVSCLDSTHNLSGPLDLGQQHMLLQGGLVVRQDGSFSRYALQIDQAGQNVSFQNWDMDSREEQTLLSLPAYKNVDRLQVSIRPPTKTRRDKITFILNKVEKPYYTLKESKREAPPMIITKDVRAIAPTKTKTIGYEQYGAQTETQTLQGNKRSRSALEAENSEPGPSKKSCM